MDVNKGESLVSELQKRGVVVKARGNVSCLFHVDAVPSMAVDRERGLYHCHSCGRGGDVITLVQELDNLSFEEAKSVSAVSTSQASVTPSLAVDESPRLTPTLQARLEHLESVLRGAEAELVSNYQGQAYIASRGLTEATARHFRLGVGTESMGVFLWCAKSAGEFVYGMWYKQGKRRGKTSLRTMRLDADELTEPV